VNRQLDAVSLSLSLPGRSAASWKVDRLFYSFLTCRIGLERVASKSCPSKNSRRSAPFILSACPAGTYNYRFSVFASITYCCPCVLAN
jgi:hypothetical protein